MVVEIVNPYKSAGDANYRRDYVDKRKQFEQRKIPEYWIVDPTAQQMSVLVLTEGNYQASVFKGNQRIESSVFPKLSVTTIAVLST